MREQTRRSFPHLCLNADGGDLNPLFPSSVGDYDFAPHFTSDGKEIYFGRSKYFPLDGGTGGVEPRFWDVHSASLDGENERTITNRHFELFRVSYSDDGRRLVISGDVSSGSQLHLYSLDDTSGGEKAIQPLIPNAPGSPEISNLVMAADGRSIYFMAAANGKKSFDYDVYHFDFASDAVEKLTVGNGYATDLCVSSDGRTAAFLRWTSRWGSFPNVSKLYTIDLATKHLAALGVTGSR